MPLYRPSCVVNFKLRFDEALTLSDVAPAESVQDRVDKPPVGVGSPKPTPLILQTGADNTSFVMARIPKTLNLEKPGYRQAAKFSATFDFRDLPIDPRTVRAAALEIHIGTVTDQDFSNGFRNRTTQGRVSSVLQTRTQSGSPNQETLRLVGIVDDWEVTHDSKGSEVTMSGRDLRGVLLDTPIDAGLPKAEQQLFDSLDMSQTIDVVVMQILSFNPLFEEFTVVTNPNDWANGILPKPGADDIVPRHRKGARGNKAGGRATPNASSSNGNINFWDLIVRVCYLVGGIPYFRGTELVIRPAQTVYDKLRGPVDPVKNPTPFAGGRTRNRDEVASEPITPPLRVRRLVYGRDVERNSFNRKYGGWRRPKVVRTISLDQGATETGAGKVVIGIWPPIKEQDAKVTRKSPAGEKSSEEILNVPVPGIVDKERLTQIAKSIYNEIGRGEMGGQISTVNLSSFGGGNADPDLLRLEPGDGIELLVDTRSVRSGGPLISTFTDSVRRSFEDQVKEILKQIPDENLARVIVATARGQVSELQRFFRVENVKFTWSHKNGIRIDFDYQNYVTVRDQVDSNASADPGTAQRVTTPRTGNKPPGNSLRSL